MTRKSRPFWNRLTQAMKAQAVKTDVPQRLQPTSALRPLALEQRFMFDGAAAVDVAHAATDAAAPAAAEHMVDTATALRHALTAEAQRATEASPATTQRQEVVFVDSNVRNYQQLVSGLKPGTEVVVLDASKDGLQQIADYLDGRSGIDAIHILSHGDVGKVQLGNDWLEGGDLAARSGLLNAIGQSLDSQGDILLYGCQVGADGIGVDFVQSLASATGADIAVSSDMTGAASKGGDWALEVSQGEVETVALDLTDYTGLLAAFTDDLTDANSVTSVTSFTRTLGGVSYTFTFTSDGDGGDFAWENINGFNNSASINMLSAGGTGAIERVTIARTDGQDFAFSSIFIDNASGGVTNVRGYLDGVAVGTNQTMNASSSGTLSFGSLHVDQVQITSTDFFGTNFDNFSGDTTPPNAAPTIGNLNGDSVAWAGVGNTVVLDFGANAAMADAELGLLNSGNGNWAGASLTVQHPGTAVSADTFGFNTSGASFTVSGNNLQAGGLTFATFTNSGGVLTINYTSSGTAATTALVNDVAHRITYRNDTPAGDAAIRFTLNDGNTSATANVTVTSDTIYVTNTTDTATIDASNGVSFSEAVAIAAADATGSQTLILSSAFAGQTVNLAGNLSINESLTLNGDSASGLTLNGSTITLGSSTTLNFSNASGTLSLGSTLAGSGSLTKAGGGTLLLSSTSNEANMSGGISVTGGNLQISADDQLSSGSLTLDGGTLTNNSTGFTIDNAIVLGSAGGIINVGGGGGATSQTLSGVISGSGTLVKNGQGILQLDGYNTYTGATNVTAGTLIANHANALGTLAGATTVSSGATVRIAGGLTIGEAFTISGTGKQVSAVNYGALHLNSGSSTLSGNITLAGDADISAAGAATLTLSGTLGGASSLNKTDAGTLTLTSASNSGSLSGGMTVTGGTLSVSSDSQLAAGTLTLNGGTLALTGATTVDNAISLAASSTVSASANATLSGSITGTGGLTKTGASTLTLSGSNNYSGATTVSAGGLSLSGGSSISDTGTVTLAAGTTLSLAGGNETIGSLAGSGNVSLAYRLTLGGDNTSTSYSGVISSSNLSGITKTGSGTFTLSGANTYTGSTTVSAGTLAVSGSGAVGSNSAVTVASGATLSSSVATLSLGSLAGAGAVSFGANTLSVGGDNTSTTYSGQFSGSGNFNKVGSGTLSLSGDNSASTATMQVAGDGTLSIGAASNLASGNLNLNNGTLAVTGSGVTLTNGGTLSGTGTIGNANALTLSGNFSGTGGLTKVGAGTLTLSGTDNYAGATNVNAGTLLVNGALSATSGVTVAAGATLGGDGSLFASSSTNTLTVQSGGTLSPGNSAGTLTVNGNLQMNAGSTLAVEINGTTAGTQYDQLLVNGTVDVSGATLAVTHGYVPGNGDSYTLIVNDAADSVTGTYSGLPEGSTLTAGGNSTVLTASYIGGTGNDFTLTAPINAAPVVGNLNGDSVGVIESDGPTLLDAGGNATVTDSDSANFDGGNVTVAIVANRASGEDILAIVNQGSGAGQIGVSGSNITFGGVVIGSFTGGTGANDLVISLNANATPAAVQALVRNITYSNSNTLDPSTETRTVRVTVNDGDGATSSNADIAVSVTGVNDAPTLSATGGTPTYTENGVAVDLFSGVSIGTIEAGQTITGLTLTVGNLANGASEILRIDGTDIALVNGASGTTGGNGIGYSVSVSGGTATVTLTHAGLSTASAQTVIDGMTYRNSSEAPTGGSRAVTLTSITDNGGTSDGGVDSTIVSIAATVGIEAVNDAPSISAPGSIAVTEDVSAALTGISFADVDAGAGSVTATFSVGSGTLAATSASGVTVGGSGTGTLTLSGSLADINAFIAASGLGFTTASNATANVTLTIAIDDGGNTGTDPGLSGTGSSEADSATLTLVVSAVNDAPVNSVPAAQTTDQDANLVFNSGNGNLISISDVDAGSATVQVTLTASNGLITLNGTTGLSFLVGSGTSDATLTFEGSIADINSALNGLVFSPTGGYNGSASLQVSTSDLGLSGSGGTQTDTDTINITVSPINPKITDVSTTTPDGGYKVGDVITVTVTFDQSVTVAGGVPTLLLETGLVDRNATYVSGSGSNTLTFSYTVQAGDVSADLDFQSTGALALNGATIRSAGNDDAILTLPTVGGANSIAGQNDILIDGVAPTVTSVSVPANGTYVAGQNLDFTVNLSENTTVDTSGGTPRIQVTLNNGQTAWANYVSGSGSNALVFRLDVVNGQLDTNGITLGNAIDLHGATLGDGAGNDAVTALHSVGDTSGVKVDAVVPVVDSVSLPANGSYKAGDVLSFTVNTSEGVVVDTLGGTPRLVLTVGGVTRYANYVSGAGGGALVFQYTVQAGDSDSDGISVGSSLDLNGGSVKDAAGNDLTLALNSVGSTAAVLVDTGAPSVTGITRTGGTISNGSSVSYDVTFSEDVSGVDISDFGVIFGGTVTGTLASVTRINGSAFSVVIDNLSGTGTLTLSLNNSGTGIVDAANNAVTGGLVGQTYTIDRVAPTVTSVGVPGNGTYVAGQSLDFTVNLSENTTVDTSGGTPRIQVTLDNGQTAWANYVSGSGSNALVFRLSVANGQLDSDGITLGNAIDLHGATLGDAAGNDAVTALHSVGDTSGVKVDAVVPVVDSVSLPANGSYKAGDVLSFTVNTSEGVVVDTLGGTPRLVLTVGGVTRYANYVSGAGGGALVFQYTVQSGDTAASGISVNGTLDLNGGHVNDPAGNALNLNLGAVGNTGNVLVDTTTPYATNITRVDTTPTNSGSVSYTVTFNENVGNVDARDFNLIFGGSVAGSIVDVIAVDGHTFTVKVSGLTGTGTVRLDLRPGTDIADAAGNQVPGGRVGVSYSIDRDAPSVTAVDVPTNGTYVAGQNLNFTVHLSENVQLNTSKGSPRLEVTLGNGQTAWADYVSGAGTNALLFRLTVATGQLDTNGITVGNNIQLNGATLRDSVGNDAQLVLNGLSPTDGVLVDAVAPVVSSVVSPADGSYKAGDVLSFSVHASEGLLVSGSPRLVLDVGGATRYATLVPGSSNGSTLVFQYTVQAGDNDANGIGVSASLDLNGGTVRDAAGNDLTLTLNGLGATSGVIVDTVRPTASIVVSDNALSVGETSLVTITFSEAVTGLDLSDFTVEHGALSNLTPLDGGITWTATLTPTVGVTNASNLITLSNSGYADAAGNTGAGTTDSNHYAIDTQRPTATIVVADTALAVGETSTVTITFSEAVSGLDIADFNVEHGALSNLASSDDGLTWTATLTPTTSITDATNVITLDNTGYADAAGNSGAGTTDSNNYAIDTQRPTATIVVADTALAVGESSTVTITFSEAVTGLDLGDFTVANGVLSNLSSSDGITWKATLTPMAGVTNASNLITLNNSGYADAAGNTGTGTMDSNYYAIDTQRPTATIVVTDNALKGGETSLVTITFSEAVSGLDLSDFTVEHGALSHLMSSDGGKTWTATLTPTAGITDTTNVITLNNTGYVDAAGNSGTGTTASNVYAIDTLDPVAPEITLDQATLVNGRQVSPTGVVFISALEAGGSWQYSLDNGVSWIEGRGNSVQLPGFGAFSIWVQQRDVAGNASPVTSLNAVVEPLVPPAVQPPGLPAMNDLPTGLGLAPFQASEVSEPNADFLQSTSAALNTSSQRGGAQGSEHWSGHGIPQSIAGLNDWIGMSLFAPTEAIRYGFDPAPAQFSVSTGASILDLRPVLLASDSPWDIASLRFSFADRQELPGWVRLDRQSGQLTINAPKDLSTTLVLQIKVSDGKGHESVRTLKVVVGDARVTSSAPAGRAGLSEKMANAANQQAGKRMSQYVHG
ncbi:Ig-like domain-containing protein [Comamonas testosteroni]|uniref:Ig-like domain-containing protein n=1 Tax=Comamonas testosteroni TaxID=285 RepID=UPI00391CB407